MPFDTRELHELEDLLDECGSGAQTLAQYRCRFPGKSLTRCDDSDIGADSGIESPFKRYGDFDLYFVDGRNHCWNLTADPALATGIVLAQHKSRP